MSPSLKITASLLYSKMVPLSSKKFFKSFKVLILELRSLGLDISMYKIEKEIKGQINNFEIDIMEKSNLPKFIPTYQSMEII